MDELGLALHMETTNSGGIGLAFKLLTAGLFLEPDHHSRWGGKCTRHYKHRGEYSGGGQARTSDGAIGYELGFRNTSA